jgi:hypothetical protein
VFVHVSKRRWLPVIAIAAFGMLLSGCAGLRADAPTVNRTSSGGSTVSTTAPTPTPTPIAVDLTDPSSWVIDFTGVGPLAIGQAISETDQSTTAFTVSGVFDSCPSPIRSFDRPGFPNLVIAGSSDDGLIELIALEGGPASSEYTATSPRTSAGIGIGATLDELKTAYPAITYQDDHFTPHYALSDGNGNWINFAVFEGLVNKIVVRPMPVIPREICG